MARTAYPILGIDPGTKHSAWIRYEDGRPVRSEMGIENNSKLLTMLRHRDWPGSPTLAIEWVESFGMAVGREVFETTYWIGRFLEAWLNQGGAAVRIGRRDIKLHLCGQVRANDANIRAALIDRYGASRSEAIGLKGDQGPLYGVKAHIWSALAVAVTAAENKYRWET